MALSPIPSGLNDAEKSAAEKSAAEGDLILTLMVLNDPEFTFKTAVTAPVSLDTDIKEVCRPIFENKEKPSLVWAFAPCVGRVAGDLLVEAVTELTDGALVFGGFAVDDSPTFQENCFVIMNGGAYLNNVAFIMFYGDIKPSFFNASISEKRLFDRDFMITEANGAEIISINDRSSTEFLELIGITPEMARSAVLTNLVLGIFVDENSYYPRQIVGFSDNDTILLGGTVEAGTRFRIGGYDKTDMLLAAQNKLKQVADLKKEKSFAFIFSCASRSVLLGSESLDEIHMVRETLGDLPFIMANAGGEICPLSRSDGTVFSHFQNGAFIICVI
jgi:small ligand-binding sensory domain FIST